MRILTSFLVHRSDTNIDGAFARSRRTLHADQIPKAIGAGAIGFLKGFGRRSVEVMRGRSPVLLRIQEGISHQWESDRPSKSPKASVKGDRSYCPNSGRAIGCLQGFGRAIGGGDEGAIARVAQNSGGDQSSMGERSPLQTSKEKREARSLIPLDSRRRSVFCKVSGERSVKVIMGRSPSV